jgi:hypothetical protein
MTLCENQLGYSYGANMGLTISPREIKEILLENENPQKGSKICKILEMYENKIITINEAIVRILAIYCDL